MNVDFQRAGLRVFERGWLSSNNVLFGGDERHESVLVDTGYWSHADQTLALVQQALGGRALDRIVNTHLHSDHCGANHRLQSVFHCVVDVPAGEAARIDAWDEAALTFRATGQHCPQFVRQGVLSGGDLVQLGERSWQVIASPGHDPESMVLYQPDLQILISADALWENGFGVVFPELEGASAFDAVRATLEQIAALPIRTVIPGHGSPFSNTTGALKRAFDRLDSFVADPRRHARHGVKVLIKFHMLEARVTTLAELHEWMRDTPYFGLIRRTHFAPEPFETWAGSLLADLCGAGAIRIADGVVYDQ